MSHNEVNNFCLLNCKMRSHQSLADFVNYLESNTIPKEVARWNEPAKLITDYHYLLGALQDLLLSRHLGTKTSMEVADILFNSSTLVTEFYSTNWYLGSLDSNSMRKTLENKEFAWYRFFNTAAWTAMVTDDRRLVSIMADWTESWFEPEWLPIPVDSAWAKFYLSVFAAFRSKPLDGQEELEAQIRKNRKREPKLLFSAWEAARKGDQPTFDRLLEESVRLFDKTAPTEIQTPDCAIALPQSFLLAAARRLGMQIPKLSDRLLARLPTTESIGLQWKGPE